MTLYSHTDHLFEAQFEVGSVALSIYSDSAEQLACLNEYLAPYSATRNAGHGVMRAQIHVSSDEADWEPARLECLASNPIGSCQHHPDTRYKIYRLADGATAFFAQSGYPHLILRKSTDRYYVIHPGTDDPESPKPALRLAREIVVAALEGMTGATIHASSATFGDRGILMVGESGAGKTTCAVAAALEPGGAFISGDRTVVQFETDRVSIAGWPMAINVGESALAAFLAPNRRAMPSAFRNAYFDGYYANHGGPAPIASGRKLALSPVEFERFGISFRLGARLAAVIFPKIRASDDTFSHVQRLRPEDAVAGLKRELKICDNSGHGYGLVPRYYTPASHEEDTLRRIEMLCDTVPCMSLTLSHSRLNQMFARKARLSDVIGKEFNHA